MRSAQEILHGLEMGAGARWLRVAAAIAVTVAVSLLITWKQFHGPQTEATLEQADVGRQLAAGNGFSTLVNHPQTAAVLRARGIRFDPRTPYPELHQAPLYPLVIAAGLRLLPAGARESLFAAPAQATDGYAADYFLLGLNLLLLWLAAWLAFVLGRKLFDVRVGWVSLVAVLVSLSFWQQTLALNGTPLLMVISLGVFLVWRRIETAVGAASPAGDHGDASEVPGSWRRAYGWLAVLGVLCALAFLSEYSAGAILLVAIAYAAVRPPPARRGLALATLLAGFVIVAAPWLTRNLVIAGNPVALAAQGVALKAGDPTADPWLTRATLSAETPPVLLRKLGNKTLTSVQENLKSRLWSGGAMWFVAFFVAGWMYRFRSPEVNRLRWMFAATFAVALCSQAAMNAGDSERLVVVWLAPLMIVFGAGFFFVLLGSNPVLGAWPRALATALLALQSLPLVHDALAPAPGIRFNYPPYFPALLRGMQSELADRHAGDRFGAMADIPAGVAWYGRIRVWSQPATLRDFYAITLEQPVGELLLTPRTLDRPFFSELNARPVVPGSLASIGSRFGEWGEIYAGLLTGTMPREFPLKAPHRVAENLYVLLNPGMPAAVREK